MNGELSTLRVEWAQVRSQLHLTCQRINCIEEELAQARSLKRDLQFKLTQLEVREKEILGEVKYLGRAESSRKTKVTQAISNSVKEAFANMSDTDKAALVNSLLEGLL
jgi:hypothetical protein